jgi:hypothetical protein
VTWALCVNFIQNHKKEKTMSKESYARGFCKAAEAAGVDPVALAKYAAESSPEFKTEGYAPESVSQIGADAVPLYRPPVYDYANNYPISLIPGTNSAYPMIDTVGVSPEVRYIRGDSRKSLSRNEAVLARARANPKYLNWLIAHTRAMDAVSAAARGTMHKNHFGGTSGVEDPELNKMLADLYHKNMMDMTNAAPAQVSAPAKK